MRYDETLHYLYSQMPDYQQIGNKAYKEGLHNSLTLDRIFNSPHRRYRTIHVGGTNGKGSVSHLIAAILKEAGYRVGLYTSPHLIDFRERIRVDGEMISKEYVVDFVEKYREQIEPVKPSFFEITMEMAFLYFAEQHVDVAVVEVGLGGRLDSTNIINPDLSVITNISEDHVKILGDTLPKIAAEKAGIIKPYTPVIIGEMGSTGVAQAFIDKAKAENAPLIFAQLYMNNFKAERKKGGWLFHADGFPNVKSQLSGLSQDKNARTVLTTIEVLREIDFEISKEAVYNGFANVIELTGLQGRWQELQSFPRVICDIAHNTGGILQVVEQLQSENYKRLHILFGMASDKDVGAVLSILPRDADYYFTKASVERALGESELAVKAAEQGLKGLTYPTVALALEAALKNADKDDLIFIGGSSFIVADALQLYLL